MRINVLKTVPRPEIAMVVVPKPIGFAPSNRIVQVGQINSVIHDLDNSYRSFEM